MPCRGFLFFCVRRKETKEDRITSKHSTKNFSIHTPLSLPVGLLFFCVRRKVAKEERIYISAIPQKQTASYRQPRNIPDGGLLFFCVRRKEAKEDHIYISANSQKQTAAYRYPLTTQNFLPNMRFSGGSGGGLFPGKSLLPPYRHLPPTP